MCKIKQIDIKEFFKNSTKRNFKLSPDRKKVAYLDNYKERSNIYIMNLETKEIKLITKQQKRNINSYSWKGNDYIFYLQDNDGDENDHVWMVELKTLKIENITPQKKLKVFTINPLNKEFYIKNIKEHKNKIYIVHNGENAQKTNSYLYDVKSKKWKKIEKFEQGESAILIDDKTLKSDYVSKIIENYTLILKNGKEVKKVKSSDSFEIIGYTSNDKKELYVLSNIDKDKIGLFKADLNTNIISNCLFENQVVDIQTVTQNYETKKLEKAIYMEEKYEIHYFDKKLEKDMKLAKNKLIEKFSNEKDSIISCSYVLDSNKEIILLDTHSDKKPTDEYLFNVKKNEIIKFTEDYKWYEYMTDMKPISYKARDGLIIHGYLTLPKNAKGPIPIIVHPHGGPWARDGWWFNREVQFFANRGYGVLQMNFRNSTGYGKNHFVKGWKQWGLACQDDITDGTNWLIEKGYTKHGQIGIYGGSYGGYATLMGIIREPKLYSGAIDYVGISNMFTFWDNFPPYWEVYKKILKKWVGNPYDDEKHAKLVSPYYRSNEIETPLFVVQGAQDPRVPKQESDQIVDALKKRNKKVKYMVKDDEGHGFRNQENKFELYQEMINFFDENLKKIKTKL